MKNRKKPEYNRNLITKWGEAVEALSDKDQVLCEYPRPTMERPCWQCLNGLWKYAFTDGTKKPVNFDGDILVPFSPETRLSGVRKTLLPGMSLWYERRVRFSEEIKRRLEEGERLFLHFGAVDWHCEVLVNGEKVGEHDGGYLPFTFDITERVSGEACTIRLRVEDASDTSYHSVGKQTLKPGGMYYPAVSGIWQTVWLECVPAVYLDKLWFSARYDGAQVRVKYRVAGDSISKESDKINISNNCYLKIIFLNKEYGEQIIGPDSDRMDLPDFIPWTPENPYLYYVRAELYEQDSDRLLDAVESYFAMRKCSIGTDGAGIRRIFLNNEPYMQVGLLDQGYWPESLYTAPSDEAFIYDIQTAKKLGFNMLRKHVKVEPERYYYHCDRLGMLVWQDAVNGGRKNKSFYVTYLATVCNMLGINPGDGHPVLLSRQDEEGRREYRRELAQMVRQMRRHPCVVCIVPFNEGWGQFETERMTKLVRRLDRNVIVDQASGWFDMGGGDLKSIHHYFMKLKCKKEEKRALALTEFGGYVRRVEGHTLSSKVYGYRIFEDQEALNQGYGSLMREVVLPAARGGISATVYTQLSDVEEEINGILTYDRRLLKMDGEVLKKWNRALKDALLIDKKCT